MGGELLPVSASRSIQSPARPPNYPILRADVYDWKPEDLSTTYKRPKPISDEATLYDYAIAALGRKMRTVAELKRLLRYRVARNEAGEILVEMVILRLKAQRYLNDSNYATTYSAFRRDNEKLGPRRVITDLKAKGVHSDVIEKAVSQAFSVVNEERQARSFLQRKRLKKPANDREAARIFRALMRAGFRSGVAIKILKNWDVDEDLLTLLEDAGSAETEG